MTRTIPNTLFDVLKRAALDSKKSTGISAYTLYETQKPRRIAYASLLQECCRRASSLQTLNGFRTGGIILLHFNDHLDNIIWFWSVLLAGCVPALSSPLPHDLDQRSQHLQHLSALFDKPICLTRQVFRTDFAVCHELDLIAIEDIELPKSTAHLSFPTAKATDLAALMLTSGSTGNAKAVELSHCQVLASLLAKDSVTRLDNDEEDISLLNWIGMDHVAALVETHLLAMYCNLDQVHVQPADIVSDPVLLLRMVTRHRVARTVAPNFLLAAILKAAEKSDAAGGSEELEGLDLSCLTQLVSGGEANPVQLCAKLDDVLRRFGAPKGVLQPAFGMTETCAGCTYNDECPEVDVHGNMGFASLGRPVGGFEVRVVKGEEDERLTNESRQRGILQIRGPMVFSKYYNNPQATALAFTKEGWFDTGDEAVIDSDGRLHLVGRIKDQIRINGISIVASDLESQLNRLSLSGARDGFFAAFGYRPISTADEKLAVLYLPSHNVDDTRALAETHDAIVSSVVRSYGISPYVLAVGEDVLQKSTLGKLSRGKLRQALEQGKLERYEIDNAPGPIVEEPRDELEEQILAIFREVFGADDMGAVIGVSTPWFQLGITSIQLIRLKRKIEIRLGIHEVPLVQLLKCSTVAELSLEIRPQRRRDSVTGLDLDAAHVTPSVYDPVVQLRNAGSKTPLWLFHPGVGEVLVFINMATRLEDRPVYALRARGFNEGEAFFEDIDDAVETYYHAIKRQQPHGRYALAGYSYGAMLAFETAKRLERDGAGERVEFLASFNLPPHIKFRMRQLDWRSCAVHLAHFLGLLRDPDLDDQPGCAGGADRASLVASIFDTAPSQRLHELALTQHGFQHWADLAHAMQSMAREYEPAGAVGSMDVFYCRPLAVVAQSKQEWLDTHLRRWGDFAADVRFHEVGGEHYTMIDRDHVTSFVDVFSTALAARGL